MTVCLIDCGAASTRKSEVVDKTTQIDAAGAIVAAYVSRHQISRDELVQLIGAVADALTNAVEGTKPKIVEAPVLRMPIAKTITHDVLFSLEDGKPYRALKRHLTTRGMTPDDYRAKWGLPHDYPMVAASYSVQRREHAVKSGLGTKKAGTEPEPEPAKRGRPRKKSTI